MNIDILKEILGEDGALALNKAAERSPILKSLLIPQTILSWINSTGLITADFTSCATLEHVTCGSNPNMTSINISGLTNLIDTNLSTNTSITSLNASGCTLLQGINADNNTLLTSLVLTGCSSLVSITAGNCSVLSSFTFPASAAFTELTAVYSGFSTAMLDYVAANLVANSLINFGGIVNVQYNAGSPPSAAGILNYGLLTANGWNAQY